MKIRNMVISVAVMCLSSGAVLAEEFSFDEIRNAWMKKGIEISGKLMTEKEILEMKKLELELEHIKFKNEQVRMKIKEEMVGKIGELTKEAKQWDLSEEDIDLIVALYYANWAACPGETFTMFPMGGENIAFVSFYVMVRRFYDAGRPIKSNTGVEIKKIPASEYPEFLDYYIAYLKRKWINYPDNMKEVTLLFLPEKEIECEEGRNEK